MEAERRQSSRYPFYAAAEVTEPISRHNVLARTNELSRGGCYVDVLSPVLAGAEIVVRLVHEGETVTLPAHVVHAEPNMGMGVVFGRADAGTLQVLERWFRALEPETPS